MVRSTINPDDFDFPELKPKRLRLKRNFFKFKVHMGDLSKELKHFASKMGKELADEIEKSDVVGIIMEPKIRKVAGASKSASPRILAVMQALARSNKVVHKSGHSVGQKGMMANSKKVLMQLGEHSYLDRHTRISTLDRLYRPHHIAPFNQPPNPPKKIGQQSKEDDRYALWRILEFGRRSSYPISSHNRGMVFTTAKNGYTRWVMKHTVTWEGKGPTVSGVHYMLDKNYQAYQRDKKLYRDAIAKGVKRVIQKYTRFRR